MIVRSALVGGCHGDVGAWLAPARDACTPTLGNDFGWVVMIVVTAAPTRYVSSACR
jgi:hypothetical protein